jgi:acetyltransferase-like isoleucine patch superfamily enzyme
MTTPEFAKKRSPLLEKIITGLLSWVPEKPGMLLRGLFYPRVFAQVGKGTKIEYGSDFRGTHRIELGRNVFVGRNACLDAADPAGRIQLEDQVHLSDNVCLLTNVGQGTIILRENVSIDRGVDMKSIGGRIEIGQATYIGPYVCLAGAGNIIIGEHCMIASHSGIYANNHLFDDLSQPIMTQGTTTKGIVIEDDCWLGTGVKVLDGVTIGRGSVIGAGAVVTKNIPPFSVAVGIPAKVVSRRDRPQSKLPASTVEENFGRDRILA